MSNNYQVQMNGAYDYNHQQYTQYKNMNESSKYYQHHQHKHKQRKQHHSHDYDCRHPPKPPISLPLYYQTPNHFISDIEPTSSMASYSALNKPTNTKIRKHDINTKTNHCIQDIPPIIDDNKNIFHYSNPSKSSVHSIHSPSEISMVSSKSSNNTLHNTLNKTQQTQLPPKQSIYINNIYQQKEEIKNHSFYSKNKETYAPIFYRHQMFNDNNNNTNYDSIESSYDTIDYTHFHSMYPLTATPNNSKRRQKPKQRKKRKRKKIEKKCNNKSDTEEEIEYNYNYNIVTDENGEMYIDITIDLQSLQSNLTYYNLPSPSQQPPDEQEEKKTVINKAKTKNRNKKLVIRRLNQRQSLIECREKSIQKHESILLEILKCRNRELVINAIRYARCDVLCYFLSIIAFTLCASDKIEWRSSLLQRLSERIIGQSDLMCHVQFLLESYNNITEVQAVFGPLVVEKNNKNNIDFWNSIMKKKTIRVIDVANNTVIRDPINQLRAPINRIIIRKIINSNSKPLLLDTYNANSNRISSTFILKYGDDLRKDKACMLVFKWMNHLWRRSLTSQDESLIRILTYKVIPMTTRLGCIELISDCIPLRDITKLKDILALKPELINNLIISSAGSYIAAYIMGIRDRHFDNILIRKTDFQLFHIDMNYILGDTLLGIDANQFGITKELYDIFGPNNYNSFIDLACRAFQLLRQYNEEFINFTCLAFSYVCDYKTVRSHILKQLRLTESEYKAKNWLRNTLSKAPFDLSTNIKNKIHKFATR